MQNEEITWFCDPCQKRRTKRRSTMNASINSPHNQANTPTATTQQATPIPQDNGSTATLQVILKELQELKGKQNESIQHITDLKDALENYKKITDDLIQENITLRNDNEILRTRINNIEEALNADQQSKLDHNIIINGITETNDENTTEIITKMAKAIDVELLPGDIISAARMATASKSSGLPKSIIVQLSDKNKRDLLIKNRKKLMNNNNSRPVYITEQLSKKQQFIFKKARDLKRENKIRFAWVKDGKILIRKTPDSKAVHVTSINDLKNFDDAQQ